MTSSARAIVRNSRRSPLEVTASVSRSGFRSGARTMTVDHPFAGVTVLTGLVLAILALPADVVPRGALRAPALLFVCSLCLVPALTVLRDPKSMFRAEHILVIGPA